MPEIDLATKFPEMQPVTNLPSLGSVYGIGLELCGRRDEDAETRTYVTSQCFCVFSIPLAVLRSFRVVNSSYGLVIIGQEPTSAFAKIWNLCFGLLCVVLPSVAVWNSHTSTAEYIARKKLAKAAEMAAVGDVVGAAENYRSVVAKHPDHAAQADEGMKSMLMGPARQATLQDVQKVLKIASEFQSRRDSAVSGTDIESCGQEVAERFEESDSPGALQLLDSMALIASKSDRFDAIRLRILSKLVDREPDNPEWASQLAVIYERSGDMEKCEGLLEPHRQRVGHTEGARILGLMESRRGHLDQAIGLLSPYVGERLPKLRLAEQAYRDAIRTTQEQVIAEIEQGKAPADLYQRTRNANPEKQDAIAREYVESRLQESALIKASQQSLILENRVVPVTLELGMLRLNRAQKLSEQDERTRELEEAEKLFLAIRGSIGESDEYRVYLGQVYYWLGRSAEGRQLFDELLENHHRSFQILLSVSNTLFNLGAVAEARSLSEEAYNQEVNAATKHQAALQRSMTPIDEDDRLTWLRRANPADHEVSALLNDALATRAIAEHRDQDAVRFLRNSLEDRSKQVEQTAMLNNGALTQFRLFRLTGDRAEFAKGVEMLDRAVKLDPSNGILLNNTASAALNSGLMEILGDRIDLKILKLMPDFDYLAYLYNDEAGWQGSVEKVRGHPQILKALDYADRAVVLAPKRISVYEEIRSIQSHRRDADGLRKLLQRLESVKLDFSDAKRIASEYSDGKFDGKLLKDLASNVERYGELLQSTRTRSPAATFAVASGLWLKARMAQDVLGVEIDFEELVRIAEEAHTLAPSEATSSSLYHSLLCRASHDLARAQPDYAQMIDRSKRSLGPTYLVAVALSQPGELRRVASDNSDVRRAAMLIIEEMKKLPHRGTPWDWAVVQAFDPSQAAQIGDRLLHDEMHLLDAALLEKLSPPNAPQALHAYWKCQISENHNEANEVVKRYADQGVRLPIDPQ